MSPKNYLDGLDHGPVSKRMMERLKWTPQQKSEYLNTRMRILAETPSMPEWIEAWGPGEELAA